MVYVKKLRDEMHIIADAIGTPVTSRKQNLILIRPFILMKYDVYYLQDKNIAHIQKENYANFLIDYKKRKGDIKYKVYLKLKEMKYYITSGAKFGADFLVYTEDPNFVHSDYLVYCIDKNDVIKEEDVISRERVGVNTKKRVIFAFVGKDESDDDIQFIEFKWMQI